MVGRFARWVDGSQVLAFMRTPLRQLFVGEYTSRAKPWQGIRRSCSPRRTPDVAEPSVSASLSPTAHLRVRVLVALELTGFLWIVRREPICSVLPSGVFADDRAVYQLWDAALLYPPPRSELCTAAAATSSTLKPA
jgi:hypothetical protein